MVGQGQRMRRPRKWIIVGPGILIAAIIALEVMARDHQTRTGPPIVEHQIVRGQVGSGGYPAGSIEYILTKSDRLQLTEAQVGKLGELRAAWQAKIGPITREMNSAAADFERFMRQSGRRASMRDIQDHAAVVSELSRQLSSIRRIYWERALQILDAGQRETLEQELQRQANQGTAKTDRSKTSR